MWLGGLDPEQMDDLRRKLEKEYEDYFLYGDGASRPNHGKPIYETLTEEKLQDALRRVPSLQRRPVRRGEVDGSE